MSPIEKDSYSLTVSNEFHLTYYVLLKKFCLLFGTNDVSYSEDLFHFGKNLR